MEWNLLDFIKEEADIEIFKFFLNTFLLIITWTLGRRLMTLWDIKKRERELNLETRKEFQKLFGEFKSNIRLWHAIGRPGRIDDARDLHEKVVDAEGLLEAFLIDMASQKTLAEDEITILGLYRQGYQTIRQAIQKGEADDVPYDYKNKPYRLINGLVSSISKIVTSVSKKPSTEISQANIRGILNVRSKEWKTALRKIEIDCSNWNEVVREVTIERQKRD